MRVLTYGLSADKLGGIETYLLNMNKFMSTATVFDYVIEGTETIHQKSISDLNGKIYYIPQKRNCFANLLAWCKLLKKLKKQIDCIYFNLYSFAWFLPIIICRLFGYRVYVHAHNNNLHNCGIIQHKLHCFGRFIQKYLNIIRLTNSQESSRFFFGDESATMIFNAIDTNRFRFDDNIRDRLRKSLRIEDKHVYGFIGRITYQKNPLFLIEIFSEIQKIDSKAYFIICGDGDLLSVAKKYAVGRNVSVNFIGNVVNIQDYYQTMDLFLLPSRFEGLGIVLIEAQTSGLPCVTSLGVVPQDAKITDLLTYISLNETAKEWAEICVEKVENIGLRKKYYLEVKNTDFSIDKEAPRLEYILCGGKNN